MKHVGIYIITILTSILMSWTDYVYGQDNEDIKLNFHISMIFIGDSMVYSGSNILTSSKTIELSSEHERLKIVLNSNAPENSQAEYITRLTNHDDEWSQWSTQREITFSNLKAGQYNFQARARLGNEVISNMISINIKVNPPFWKSLGGLTIWLMTIVLLLTLTQVIVARIESRKRHKIKDELDKCANSLKEANIKIKQQQENHNKNVQVLSLLSKSGQNIIKNSSLKGIYNTTYEEINKYFETDNIGIGIVNAPHNSIDFSSFIMNGESMPFARYNLDIVNNMKVYCYLNTKTIVLEDYQKQVGNYIDTSKLKVDQLVSGSAVYMPLYNDEMAIGVLALYNRDKNFFNSYHLGIIHNIASYLETAIINFSTERKAQRKQKILEDQTISLQKINRDLNRSQEKLQTMSTALTNTDSAVVILNKEGNMIWVNNGFTKIYGYQLDEYIQESAYYENCIRCKESIPFFKQAFEEKKSITFSLPHTNKFGHEIWTQSTLTPVFDKDGNMVQMVSVDADISSIKKAENEITKQRNEIESKNKDLTKSLEYASMIQSALMADSRQLKKTFKQSFIIILPKDIVSGDFFWQGEKYGRKYIALCDCAGHGVPGAFVSIMGKVILDEILLETHLEDTPSVIIRKLNDKLYESFNPLKDKIGGVDGMDLAFLMINSRNTVATYAGAYRPLYIVRNKELMTYQADKCSAGNIAPDNDYQFEDKQISLIENDLLIMCSDGYADQFGHINGKKLGRKNFAKLLVEAAYKDSADDISTFLYDSHKQWRGNLDQVDDISIVGIKITAEEPETAVYYDDMDDEDEF